MGSENWPGDAGMGPLWLAGTALLLFTAGKASRTLFPRDTLLQQALHLLVLSWACLVAVATALGACGLLGRWSLLSGVCGLCLGTLCLLRRPAADSGHGKATVELSLDLPGLGWLAVWGTVLSLALGHVIHDGLLTFPDDWDTLGYHLPLIDCWLQSRSLYVPHFSHWFNPGNNELLGLWIVAPFSGDFLIALNNLPATLLLALAALELGRFLGLSRTFTHLAALTVVTSAVVWRQLVDAENDVAVAALFLASVGYGLRQGRTGNKADLLLASVCLGLLTGVKYYAAGLAGLAWLAAVLAAALQRGVRAGAITALGAAVGALPWGGSWYARNVWATGYPFYPKGLLPGDDPFARLHPDLWRSTLVGNGSPEVLPLALGAVWKMTGPATFAAFVAVPATLAWLVGGWWLSRRRGAGREDSALVLALLLAGSGLLLAVTPFTAESEPGTLDRLRPGYLPVRFGSCFLATAVLGFALLLQRLSCPARLPAWATFLHLALAAAWLVQLGRVLHGQAGIHLVNSGVIAANVLLLAALVVFVWSAHPELRRTVLVVGAVAAAAGTALGIDRLGRHWHEGFAGYYDRKFETNAFTLFAARDPRECRIVVLDYRPYPFFGSGRQLSVWHPLWVPSREELLGEYQGRGVTEVAVTSRDYLSRGRYRGLYEWHAARSGHFRVVSSGRLVSLFRVVGREGTPSR